MQGDFRNEGKRIETFYDTARARFAMLEARQGECEARVAAAGIPFDANAYQSVRANSQSLTHLFMSRCAGRFVPT